MSRSGPRLFPKCCSWLYERRRCSAALVTPSIERNSSVSLTMIRSAVSAAMELLLVGGRCPAELPQRALPVGMGPGLTRRSSSAPWSDMVLTSLGIDVLRLGRLLPVTYSLSSLTCGFQSLSSTLAHAASEERIATLRMVFFIGQPACLKWLSAPQRSHASPLVPPLSSSVTPPDNRR